jgi:hypothetical protein
MTFRLLNILTPIVKPVISQSCLLNLFVSFLVLVLTSNPEEKGSGFVKAQASTQGKHKGKGR